MSTHKLLVLKSTHRMYQVENLELKLEITFGVDVQTFLPHVSCRFLRSLLLCFVFLHAVLGCGVRPCVTLGADSGFVSFCKLCAAVECVALCALYCVGVSFLLVTSVYCLPGPRSMFGVDGCILATVGVLAFGGCLLLSVLGRVSRQRRSGAPILSNLFYHTIHDISYWDEYKPISPIVIVTPMMQYWALCLFEVQ